MKQKLLFSILFLLILSAVAEAQVKVITYSSMLDKGALGEFISQKTSVEFTSSKDFSGILGNLRRLKRQKKLNFDLVLGLNEVNYHNALKEGLIEKGAPFEASAYTLLINSKTLPPKDWPKNWGELKTKLNKKILIQDPRTSEVGLTWLLNAAVYKNLSLEEAKTLPLKAFPSWSSSFAAFESGAAPALWTYATSAAYFLCQNQKDKAHYTNLPLENYPQDKNYVAAIKGKSSAKTQAFIDLLLSKEIQNEIWTKNWMFPINSDKKPECYKGISPPKESETKIPASSEIIRWLDQWGL
jgi:ABC transporter substrate-binding protein (ThiB subfamily)